MHAMRQWRILGSVRFVETTLFTQRVVEMLPDDSYRELQNEVARDPEQGDLIPQSGGLRKLRWSVPGQGKRGGTRVIYYCHVRGSTILMLYIYRKSVQGDLTKEQLRT